VEVGKTENKLRNVQFQAITHFVTSNLIDLKMVKVIENTSLDLDSASSLELFKKVPKLA
jgi:hypothetical protein